jgi:hypothetical protein
VEIEVQMLCNLKWHCARSPFKVIKNLAGDSEMCAIWHRYSLLISWLSVHDTRVNMKISGLSIGP